MFYYGEVCNKFACILVICRQIENEETIADFPGYIITGNNEQ